MASPAKKRKTAAQEREDKRLEKQERDKLICYRYARLRNATRVAQEYGVSRMYVTRLWERMPADERETLLSVREQVDEELNRKIVRAEAIAGDSFVADVIKARELLGRELLRRCTEEDIRLMTDKDFASLLRLAASIATPGGEGDADKEDDIFRTLRQHIQASINQIDE